MDTVESSRTHCWENTEVQENEEVAAGVILSVSVCLPFWDLIVSSFFPLHGS